ncbi:MAG: FAD-dependent cmnm(5)s(2)U34 oxidoreductase [Caulobacterales bacterium 32-69-10]|nr:MAG: FAD-dependent cmnm(5)s(2)U34 oxidoreductase [Caulobacterales bacterium 32-69-10]
MADEPLDWSEGAPRSRRFDDIYFSATNGLAESRAVFLEGADLPAAWKGRRAFTVGELGFGTGLNILALVDLWAGTRPPEGRLHMFSVEGYPMGRDDAARALAAWPELAGLAEVLLRQWPQRRGFHRIDFPGQGATLDLAIGEVQPALEAWGGRADAWFLDGFAPARNPQMWSADILSLVGRRSAPGARAATFTVAGAVRRGLEAAGFSVSKRPGFGRKRERLEAVRPGACDPQEPPPRVAVVGAGIAGAALVRAFRALGVEPVVYEADAPGSGASGNPAALVTPRLDAGLGLWAQIAAQTFGRAVRLYGPEVVIARGVMQLAREPRDADRFARLAAWDGFDPGALVAGPEGLEFRDGLVVEPASVLETWLRGARVVPGRVAALKRDEGVWRLLDGDGGALGEAEVVCLAAGHLTAGLADLGLRPVRGQASWADLTFSGRPSAWGGYAIPTRNGMLFGATHDRGDLATETRPEDHVRNLEILARGRPDLARALEGAVLHGRAGVRAATPDHLPLAGALGEDLHVLTGLGGRGFTTAPLLAEQVAAVALGAPPPLPRALAALLDPKRFGRGL